MKNLKENLDEILLLLKETAHEAGLFIIKNYKKDLKTDIKGKNDLVTESDRLSQKLIIKKIKQKFPGHNIIAEENEIYDRSTDSPTWIIDPIDGTTNYSHGFPFFAVSIAFSIQKEVLSGVVYNPIMNEMFSAKKNGGAFLNNIKISCSESSVLADSLLATGFPYDRNNSIKNNLINFNKLIMLCQGIRRAGSASLDICHVAAGRLDGFWELKLKPWDIAAATLIAQESGATVSSLKTKDSTKLFTTELDIFCGDILVTSPDIHQPIADNLYES